MELETKNPAVAGLASRRLKQQIYKAVKAMR